MILIINGTNRPGNKSSIISNYCNVYLNSTLGQPTVYLNLEDLPTGILHQKMYEGEFVSEELRKIQDEIVIPIKRWLIISPEYNGSYPGILKLFFDAMSVRKYKESFAYKKAGLIGVADGRAGNLRGMDDIAGFLNFLRITVFPNKLPISSLRSILSPEGELHESSKQVLNSYLNEYVLWLDS